MRKHTTDSFRQSELGRAKPKRKFLKTFVDDKLKQRRLHSDTGMVIDRTSPVAVVRIILGLIVVHLLVIGGVMLRGNIGKSSSGLAVAPTITPPPAAPAQPAPAPAAAEPQPAPVQPEVAVQPTPAAAPQPAPAADTQVHITQGPVNMETVTPVQEQPAAPTQPVAVQPAPAPAAPTTPTMEKKYLVQSGDTWGRVAAKFGITEDVLKGANPQMATLTNLPSGTYLSVLVPATPEEIQQAAQAKEAAQAAIKYYEVKRGDTLARIARKHRMTLNKLLKINNMSAADARRLQVGQKLKVSE